MKTRRKFLRSDSERYSRLGKGRKKLQRWRRPRGKHNKIRLNRIGYPVQPVIGFGTPKTESGKIKGLIPSLVHNVQELEKLTSKNIAIIARIGAKKKLDVIKKAQELNIKIANIGGKK